MSNIGDSLLGTDSDEPIVVNPPPLRRRVHFAAQPGQQHIFNSKKFQRLTVEHLNAKKFALYYQDLFHTLVNLKSYRFLSLFVGVYVAMYTAYALLYMTQSPHCVSNVQKFSHALWFSVHTAATIGYGHQHPDPDCTFLNIAIMAQVLTAAIMQAALLGIVYARFSAPGARAATIKFSSILACYRGSDGRRRLAFRVANLRRHQVLQPEVRMLLLRKEHVGGPDGPLEYRYHELPLTHVSGRGQLWLGVPSIVAHSIDRDSPLWGCTRADLEQSEAEFIVMLDGIDEMTSAAMQARHSYFPGDIRWEESFAGVLARRPSGVLVADYSNFDLTRLASDGAAGDEEMGEPGQEDGIPAGRGLERTASQRSYGHL